MADLDHLPHPPLGERAKADRDCMLYGAGFMVDGLHVPVERVCVVRVPAVATHLQAEHALLAAAVAFTKAHAELAANTGHVPAHSAAESAHANLQACAKAYGRAHAALVATA